MKWYEREVVIDGNSYPLDHLQPFNLKIDIPESKNSGALSFSLLVRFSTHCVTEKSVKGNTVQFDDEGGSPRFFSQERYNLSRLLPGIMGDLLDRQCYHTSHGRNYFIIEYTDQAEEKRDYHIYFIVKKIKEGVSVFVESAYLSNNPQKQKKKIKGKVILANTFKNKKIARHT